MKGLTEKEYNIVKEILSRFEGEFFAYGSRVKGNFTPLSDLDILVKNADFDKILPRLKSDFDNSSLPFVVNFTDGNTVSEKFYNLIKDDLVKIY